MIDVAKEYFDVLILSTQQVSFVVLARQVATVQLFFENTSPGASSKTERGNDVEVNLGEYLDTDDNLEPDELLKCLLVEIEDQTLVFKTNASLTMAKIEEDRFFSLPLIVRESGCESWVRGVTLLNFQTKDRDHSLPNMAIWIDLGILGSNHFEKLKEQTK